MKKHIYMFAGGNRRAVFRIERHLISDVIDLFGSDVTFSEAEDGRIDVSVFANEKSLLHFAQNFAPEAVLTAPPDLKEKVTGLLEKTLSRYKG